MDKIVLELLVSLFGDPLKGSEEKSQYAFDCPLCSAEKGLLDGTDGKGNLEVNLTKNVFKCWACHQYNNMHGSVYSLVKKFGNKKQLERYSSLTGIEPIKTGGLPQGEISLPKEFISLTNADTKIIGFKEALNYLRSRRIDDNFITKYNIGVCFNGDYAQRIVIPSYDSNNKLNYFVSRKYHRGGVKYKNPSISKDIIFFENKICWDSTVYICEGAFDAMVLPNAIPLLGKELTNQIKKAIFQNAKAEIVVCLDGDAWNDALKIYKDLNVGRFRGRVYMIKLPVHLDFSKVYEKYGKAGIVKCLKSSFKYE